jgi:hypothetical protein
MKRISVLLTLFLLVSINAYASGLRNMDEVRKITDAAMELVRKGDIYNMFESLKANWPISTAEIDVARDKSINQRKMVDSRFGKSLGIQYIRTDIVGGTVVKILYIEKFQRHIIRWQFYLYKPENRWFLNTFVWDDKIQMLFE